jgi:hypothetical protein
LLRFCRANYPNITFSNKDRPSVPDRSDWFCSWNPSDRPCVSSPSWPVRRVLLVEPFKQAMCIIPFPTRETGSSRGTIQTYYCSPSTAGQTVSACGTLLTGHVYHLLPERWDWFCSWNPSNRPSVSSPSRPVWLVLLLESFKQAMCIIPSLTG